MATVSSEDLMKLSKSLLLGEGDHELVVSESACSAFELSPDILDSGWKDRCPVGLGDCADPVAGLLKMVSMNGFGGVGRDLRPQVAGLITIGVGGLLGVLGGVDIFHKNLLKIVSFYIRG